MSNFFQKLISRVFIYYIEFVYATSKIIKEGCYDILKNADSEKFIIALWHGDNYCFYPLLKGENLYIVTTKDRRGDYISSTCEHFGYIPIRMSDDSIGDNSLLKIRNKISGENTASLVMTLDGPLGPYHQVKKLPLVIAAYTKRRIIALSINVKRKVQIKKRWDIYTIPLPFNVIKIYVHEPIKIEKSDLKDKFQFKKDEIKKVMEHAF